LLALAGAPLAGGAWPANALAAQVGETVDGAAVEVGIQVFGALLAGDADSVYALLPAAEQTDQARARLGAMVRGLQPCQGQDLTFLSRAVTPTHVVVTAVFDPPCGTDAYANVRACELSVELEDPHWQPTARDRPLLRCIA
jgi:hypothetical protein